MPLPQFSPLQKKKDTRFPSLLVGSAVTTDPSQLPAATPPKRQQFVLGFQRRPSGRTAVFRQTSEQASRLAADPFQSSRFDLAHLARGFDPTASQFPFQLRKGISSDASRQRAFRLGFGAGEGRTGFARRAPGQFFDPRFMFDRNFRRFRTQERSRRRNGL